MVLMELDPTLLTPHCTTGPLILSEGGETGEGPGWEGLHRSPDLTLHASVNCHIIAM
jgi:hypothetical protein